MSLDFKCSQKELLNAVHAVERIVATKTSLPITANILLEASSKSLKISANNLELGMEIQLDIKCQKEGAVLVPAKTFGALVSKLPDSEVHMKATDRGALRLSYKQSSFQLHAIPPDEFPRLAKLTDAQTISVDSKLLAEMIERTIFAVATSEEKHVLSGVLVEFSRGEGKQGASITLVATDGYRLAKKTCKLETPPQTAHRVVVPAKALVEVSRLLDMTATPQLQISLSREQIAFRIGEAYVVSRLIQGQFPDYEQVIPKSSEVSMVADTRAFLESTERAAIIAGSSANVVKLDVKSGKLMISASAPDVGSVEEIVDADVTGSGKGHIAFNVRLVNDVLKVLNTNKTVVELSGPLSPGLFKPMSQEDYLYIVMPIRTADVG